MAKISAETLLAMPRAQAWAKLQDLMLAQYYVPGVTRIEMTTPQRAGESATASTVALSSVLLPFPPGSATALPESVTTKMW